MKMKMYSAGSAELGQAGMHNESKIYTGIKEGIRAKLRCFEYCTVLKELAEYLKPRNITRQAKVFRFPWVAERLALWALQDEPLLYGHVSMLSSDVADLINVASQATDRVDLWMESEISPLLLFRQALLAQLPHQIPSNYGAFARQIDLVRRLGNNSKCRRYIESRIKMSLEDYLQLALISWCYAETPLNLLTSEFRRAVEIKFPQELVSAFLNRLIINKESITIQLQVSSGDEWFRPNVLFQFPFVRYQNQIYSWGSPPLFRHLESAFANLVAEAEDVGVRQELDTAFERYVGESLRRNGQLTLGEKQISSRFALQGGKCCDFAQIYEDCIVLIEAKNKVLDASAPMLGAAKRYKAKFKKTVMKAATQTNNVAEHIRKFSDFDERPIYRVVITNDDLLLGQADFLFDELDNETVPFILSIDELDRLTESCRLGKCTFGSFFAEVLSRREGRGLKMFAPAQLLKEEPYRVEFRSHHLFELWENLLQKIGHRPDLAASDSTMVV